MKDIQFEKSSKVFMGEFANKKLQVLYSDRFLGVKIEPTFLTGTGYFFDEVWIKVNDNWTRLSDIVSINILEE